jgi:hypothetical protein
MISEGLPFDHDVIGLGLAVVARIVTQLEGQLRVDSEVDRGSKFSVLIPLALPIHEGTASTSLVPSPPRSITATHLHELTTNETTDVSTRAETLPRSMAPVAETVGINPTRVDEVDAQVTKSSKDSSIMTTSPILVGQTSPPILTSTICDSDQRKIVIPTKTTRLRILIVEVSWLYARLAYQILIFLQDNEINRRVLGKRLSLDDHQVVFATHGQEAVDKVREDGAFDCVLMDIQYVN